MNLRKRGLFLASGGAFLWGSGGVACAALLSDYFYSPTLLSTIRMLVSGIILLLASWIGSRRSPFAIFRDLHDTLLLFGYGLFGMLGTQYFYLMAVSESNAPTGTILQYLMPLFILLWETLVYRDYPSIKQTFAVGAAIIGTAVMVTNGSFTSLSVSAAALFWGMLSALAETVYVLEPVALMKRWDSALIVGWGMIIGGIPLIPLIDSSSLTEIPFISSLPMLLIALIVGTVIPYWAFMTSVKWIRADEAAVLASLEPIASVLLSFLLLNVTFTPAELAGIALIILSILAITVSPPG